MGGKGKAPPPPDYGPLLQASRESAELARKTALDQLAWAREEYAGNKALLERVLNTQLPIMERESVEAQRLRERYNTVFQPIEDQLVREVNDYLTPGRMDFERGRAMADVANAFQGAREAALSRLESYGVDPSQARGAALDAGIRVQEAAAKAAAGTQAAVNTENTQRALRGEAINIGRGLPSNIAGAYNTAMSAGNAGFGNAMSNVGMGANTMGTGMGWMGTQNQFLNTQANALNAAYRTQMDAYNARMQQSGAAASALGSLAGMALGRFLFNRFNSGGTVPHDPADPQGKRDTIPARLSGGEFVVPASAVRRLGSDYFDKLVAQHGDAEDRRAALHRLHTGAPGGEPVRRAT